MPCIVKWKPLLKICLEFPVRDPRIVSSSSSKALPLTVHGIKVSQTLRYHFRFWFESIKLQAFLSINGSISLENMTMPYKGNYIHVLDFNEIHSKTQRKTDLLILLYMNPVRK